ncbi:MAG: hypothetical protein R3211_00480 [Balneolaceae bacterium]|nr:hypothetical protein [Balneolaceae bacterium]
MDYSIKIVAFVVLLLLHLHPGTVDRVRAQDEAKSYELVPAPDLWYNDVDGIRVGIRLRGQVPGTFDEGPHRLDFGTWFATWLPDTPVSYYLSFTEPIPSISDFASEGNIRLRSSIRTGLHRHSLGFNKRWQLGFNERDYRRLSIRFSGQKRFDDEYLQYPQLWQPEWLYLAESDLVISDENMIGRYYSRLTVHFNLAGEIENFLQGSWELQQIFPLSEYFQLRARIFAGLASDNTPPEYLFMRSMMTPAHWAEKGLTRAKGTIPVSWMEEGFIQVSGGPNLRGYTDQEITLLNAGGSPLVTSMGSVNLELDYPNPIDRYFSKIPVVGGFLKLHSYLFFDSGTSLGVSQTEEERLLSDAGLGFMLALNIPDYLGNQRGIFLRYDVPLWLSNPGIGERIEWRNIIGIGAVISL